MKSFRSYLLLCFLFVASLAAQKEFKNIEDYLGYLDGVREFPFDLDKDRNQFPDLWFLEDAPDFQTYHSLLLDSSTGNRQAPSLRFLFSGGKAGVYSAPLRLDPRFAYNVMLAYKGENLGPRFDNILTFGLRAYDKRQRLLDSFQMFQQDFPTEWTESKMLRIDRLPQDTDSVEFFIHLEGRPSGMSRLWVDDLRIKSSPRITLETGKPLNIFPAGEKLNFSLTIGGMVPGEEYTFRSVVRDFLQREIQRTEKPVTGTEDRQIINSEVEVPAGKSGVYTVDATLFQQGEELVNIQELVARNNAGTRQVLSPSFGVLLGRPMEDFKNLLLSLDILGIRRSKINLFPDDFSFIDYTSTAGITKLDPLLLKMAPDKGFRFTSIINNFPKEVLSHTKFDVNPPKTIVDTFLTHSSQWQRLLNDLLLLYGNVFEHWQLGPDSAPMSADTLQVKNPVIDFLSDKASWSRIYKPVEAKNIDLAKNPVLYIPASMSPAEMAAEVSAYPSPVSVTLQVMSRYEGDSNMAVEDLVKKVTLLRSLMPPLPNPRVSEIFIDRLSGKDSALMTANYRPRPTYFAIKTMVNMFEESEFLGSFTLPDKAIRSYVFELHGRAFAVMWRERDTIPLRLYIGNNLSLMDMMGNETPLKSSTDDHGTDVTLSSMPVIVITPHLPLIRSILSYGLTRSPVESSVTLQPQAVVAENHFDKAGKFDFYVQYPDDWLIQENVFSLEIQPGNGTEDFLQRSTATAVEKEFHLSPSALSQKDVPVWTDLEITLPDQHHFARIYRQDELASDISLKARFFPIDEGIQLDIHLTLSEDAPRFSSFLVSALFEDGSTYEAHFPRVSPGENSIQTVYIVSDMDLIGTEVTLEAREIVGSRYINQNFPVQLSYQ